jgi:integrase
MGLYKRKDSPIWHMSFCVNNRQYQRSTGTADKRLAENILAKVKTQIIEGKWFEIDEARQHTFDEMMERFMSEHAPTVSERMRKSYNVSLSHLNTFFSVVTLDKIDPDLIMQYQVYRREQNNCRPGTRNRELAMLSKAFSLARLWKWIKENPCSLVKREKEDNEIGRCLTEEEEQRLLDVCKSYCNEQLYDIVITAIHTGMRESEILRMKWSDVNFKDRTITTRQKGNSIKIVPMSDTVFTLLLQKSQVKSLSGYVFTTGANTSFIPRNMYREFQKACRQAEVSNFRFHDLRHTTGTRLAQAGYDIYAIASILGHSQLSTAKRYAKHNTKSLQNVVKSLDRKEAKKDGTFD